MVSDNVDLRQIIEDETDYLFYNILDYRDNKETDYLSNEVLIEFTLKNQVMTLKYATDHQYISLNQVMSTYPDILKK